MLLYLNSVSFSERDDPDGVGIAVF